jgi:isopentenyl-diphosphate Delta-isomerase
LLNAAVNGPEAVVAHVNLWAQALRIACFATGSASLSQLAKSSLQTADDVAT